MLFSSKVKLQLFFNNAMFFSDKFLNDEKKEKKKEYKAEKSLCPDC